MKVLLGVSLSKKNYKFLTKFLENLNNLIILNEIDLQFIFVLEEKNFILREIIFKKLINKKFKILFIKKNGIPHSRNKFLYYVRTTKSKFIGFLDDDCLIPRNWLKNMLKFIKFSSCDLVGGPQLHKTTNEFYSVLFKLIEPKNEDSSNIDWAATNNVFFKSNILLNNNHLFDEKLKNIGGSDQLFFQKLKKNFKLIYKWNINSPVYENIQLERENLRWFINRNFRYGYSGYFIEKSIYGKYLGIFINISKFFLLIMKSCIFLFFFLDKKYLFKSIFFLSKALGRFIALTNYKPKKYI